MKAYNWGIDCVVCLEQKLEMCWNARRVEWSIVTSGGQFQGVSLVQRMQLAYIWVHNKMVAFGYVFTLDKYILGSLQCHTNRIATGTSFLEVQIHEHILVND